MTRRTSEDTCKVCGGRGYTLKKDNGRTIMVDCNCSRAKFEKAKVRADVTDEQLKEYIPNDFYRSLVFNEEELRNAIYGKNVDEIALFSYIDFVKTYLSSLRMGQKPKRSYFVVAPPKLGKKIFVYTAIRECLMSGLTVSPLMDTKELYEYMEDKKFTELRELLNRDVVFITMGGSPAQADVIALRHCMDLCERLGSAMIVISRYTRNFYIKLDPLLMDDLGVFNGHDGEYGELELVGFNDEMMYTYRQGISGQVRTPFNQQNVTLR